MLRYRQALRVGSALVRASGLLTANHIIETQGELPAESATLIALSVALACLILKSVRGITAP